MKFQNPSLNCFLNGRTDTRTDGRTDKPKPICSPLFQSWGHNYHKIPTLIEPRCEKNGLLGFRPHLVRHKSGCTTTEDSWRLEILDLERRGVVLSM